MVARKNAAAAAAAAAAKSKGKSTTADGSNNFLGKLALVGNLVALVALALHGLGAWPGAPAGSSGAGDMVAARRNAGQAVINPAVRNAALSEQYLERAAKFSGEKGEGYKGWLYLLAAYDFDPTSAEVLSNLVANYRASDLTYLALDELFAVLDKNPRHVVAKQLIEEIRSETPGELESYKKRRERAWDPKRQLTLDDARFTIPFATAFARFDLTGRFPDYEKLNREFYDATMEAYEIVKKDWLAKKPDISDTELNHKLFQWQMEILRSTGDYWEGYTRLALFRDLMETMRHGAAQLLEAYGFDRKTAYRKAFHEVIFWSSVHTENSIHEPHMTEDSLIGGVYYVTIPPNSGVLDLFDPRQKIKDGLPEPPYHRPYTVQPREGMMVLFPGWLVHTVRQSVGLDTAKHGYRISISVNLKGEWQDTAKLAIDDVDMSRPQPAAGAKP